MKTIACLLLALCNAAWALDNWDGHYTYTASYGKSAGGSVMLLDYRITLSGRHCSITLDGYQTQESLRCTATREGDTLTLRFASHESGALTNAYGVALYRPGQPLLALERQNASTLRTTWLGLTGLDGKLPSPGKHFHKE